MNSKPILITGAHRSGSTWVGSMIGNSEEAHYIHEPFNIYYGPGICNAPFDCFFPYVTEENEEKYVQSIQQTLEFKYHFWEEFLTIRSKFKLRCCFRDFVASIIAKQKNCRPLFKDPIAVLSAEWLEKRFGFQVVVLIRHPAAFAGSIKRLNWSYPFDHFLKQPSLVNGPLTQFKTQIEDFAQHPRDPVDQSILLWNIIYTVVLNYRDMYPHWIFLRHEDLSANPIPQFRDLFEKLDLQFTPEIESLIRSHSDNSNPVAPPNGESILKMNSKKNIYNWKKRLSLEEIERIKEGVKDVAPHFYSLSEW